jgi:nitroimidazol reductase NimA-like FMN-containing flavoprotein (pyridoxamine 5'-phosphate oxidase superfamily)
VNLDEARIQRFLATKDVVVLSTVQRDGAPLAMPMWFLHDPASFIMISVADTQKVRNLRRAEFLADGPERRALVAHLLAKYDPRLERIWGGREMPPNRVMFRIVPTHVSDWGL